MSFKIILITAMLALLAVTGTQSFAAGGASKPGVDPCKRGIVYVCQ